MKNPGIYKVIFDNKYSWFNSKLIRYRLSVLKENGDRNEININNNNIENIIENNINKDDTNNINNKDINNDNNNDNESDKKNLEEDIKIDIL